MRPPAATSNTTHVVCRNGRIVRARTSDLFEQILQSIGLEGLRCFNYKIVKCEAQIFEINPRFGASLAPLFGEFIDYLVCGEDGR